MFDMWLEDTSAGEEAKRKGLTHVGWGRYADNQGNVVAKSEDGKLVYIDKNKPSLSQMAADFATQAHGSQQYGKGRPYSYHLGKVVDAVKKYGGSPVHETAAWLHDVLEDTPISREQLQQRFGKDIANIVDLLSNQETKEETFKRIRTNPNAVFVKLADRIANTAEGQKNSKYRKEHPLFKSILYRPGEFDEMWTEIERNLQYDGS